MRAEGGFREEGEFEYVLGRKCNHSGFCVHMHRERAEKNRGACDVRKPPLRTELHLARSLHSTRVNIYNLYCLVYACQRKKSGKRAQARKPSQAKVEEGETVTRKESGPLKWKTFH